MENNIAVTRVTKAIEPSAIIISNFRFTLSASTPAIGEKISKELARKYLNIELEEKIILFFGFIRKYKGLDILLDSMLAMMRV
jgi:glycosyltransferase involved in cell wall biosynthesis